MSIFRTDNKNIDARVGRIENDVKSLVSNVGKTSVRPVYGDSAIALPYFDSELNKPIWWNGKDWVDATGTVV